MPDTIPSQITDLALNLTGLATEVVETEDVMVLLAWCRLTRLPRPEAITLAQTIAADSHHYVARVVPF